MAGSERTRKALMTVYRYHPKMQIRDIFKYLYQSSFGCEHMAGPEEQVLERITEEYGGGGFGKKTLVEPLDGSYSRVGLGYLDKGLGARTLARLFCASAKEEPAARAELTEKIETARELVREQLLPFEAEQFEKALGEWESLGYPPVHHSDEFRAEYRPAYRVISNSFVPFLPLFAGIDKRLDSGRLILAVEGGSASGKSTLGGMLKSIYGCTVLHMDDFFLRPGQRTPERYAEAGGNIDRERFLEEVLLPLGRGEAVNYRAFDCSRMELGEAVRITPERLTVVEGAYCMHPELSRFYDLSVFLDISPQLQKKRILKRNSPELAKRFFEEWIPLETAYFSATNAKNRCDIHISVPE